VIRIKEREALRTYLAKAGIGTGIHYPVALHLQKAYLGLGHKQGDFSIAEKVTGEVLSLPMYPQLRPEQVRDVANEVLNSFGWRTSIAAQQLPSSVFSAKSAVNRTP
jgi:dTDP-4-amino-4,6-dideoxygalactose transaminase